MIAVTADLHFSPHGAWRGRGITGDAECSFRQIVDACVDPENEVRRLVALGDLVEARDVSERTPSVHRFLHEQFDRLRAAGVAVDYVLGNHDLGVDWWSLHPWPTNVDGRTFELLPGVTAHAMSYTPRDLLPARLAALPREATCLLAHQSWCELMGCGRDKADGSLDELAAMSTLECLLTGDYHGEVEHTIERPDGTTMDAWSPGPVCLQSIAENDFKSFLLGGRDPDGYLGFARIELQTRRLFNVTIRDEKTRERKLDRLPRKINQAWENRLLPDEVKKPIVVLRHDGELPGLAAAVKRICGDRAHFFEKLEGRPGDDLASAAADLAESIGPLSLETVVRELAGDDADAADLALALLRAPQPADHLRRLLADTGRR